MSFTTILGIMVGLGLFIGSIFISTDNYLVFLSLSSALMVVGGTLAATFIAYEARYVLLCRGADGIGKTRIFQHLSEQDEPENERHDSKYGPNNQVRLGFLRGPAWPSAPGWRPRSLGRRGRAGSPGLALG